MSGNSIKLLCGSLLAMILFQGCCKTPPIPHSELEFPHRWFINANAPKSTVVLVHGLNQRPSTMDDFAVTLAGMGHNVYRISLNGHHSDTPQSAACAQWGADVSNAIEEAHQHYPHSSISVIGYSLGALATINALSRDTTRRPEAVVLLAPPVALRAIGSLATITQLFPDSSFSVPSLTPARYRLFSTLPMTWYSHVADMIDKVKVCTGSDQLAAIPTLILLSPADELISWSGVEGWISRCGLTKNWHMKAVRPAESSVPAFEHVLFDPQSLGVEPWQYVTTELRNFLP